MITLEALVRISARQEKPQVDGGGQYSLKTVRNIIGHRVRTPNNVLDLSVLAIA